MIFLTQEARNEILSTIQQKLDEADSALGIGNKEAARLLLEEALVIGEPLHNEITESFRIAGTREFKPRHFDKRPIITPFKPENYTRVTF